MWGRQAFFQKVVYDNTVAYLGSEVEQGIAGLWEERMSWSKKTGWRRRRTDGVGETAIIFDKLLDVFHT
jgi:hypothetical protein